MARSGNKKRIGELLVESGLLTRENLERILVEQKGSNKKIGELVAAGSLARMTCGFHKRSCSMPTRCFPSSKRPGVWFATLWAPAARIQSAGRLLNRDVRVGSTVA